MKKHLLIGFVVVSSFFGALSSVQAAAQDFPADFDWMRVWYLQNNHIDICDPNVYPGFESDWGIAKPTDCLDGTARKLTFLDVANINLYQTVNGIREPRKVDLGVLFPTVNQVTQTQQVEVQPVETKEVKVELSEVEKKALEAQKENKTAELSEEEKKALELLAEMNK